MVLKGFDVSHYQSGFNFWNVADIDFLIIKASEGTTFKDPKFLDYMEEARKHSKLTGAYHVITSVDAKAQAEYFYNIVKNYNMQFIPIIDVEPNYSATARNIENFVKYYYNLAKVYPWIYINFNMLKNYNLVSDYVKSHCGIWLAGYPKTTVNDWFTINDLPYTYQNVIKKYTFAAWQFTSRFKGNNLDADIAFLASSNWDDYAKGDNKESAATPKTDTNKSATATVQGGQLTGNKWILARKVIDGLYGNGNARKMALGNRYNEVQNCVNILLKESDSQLATRVIRGEFGNGNQRREILGNRYYNVQALVNKRV